MRTPALAEEDQDLDAVRESLAEWHAGDLGIPLSDAFDKVRLRHGFRSGMKYRVVLQRLAVQDLGDAFAWVGGHGAAADNKQAALMDALAFAFLWKELKK